VGDVLTALNASGIGIQAKINTTGDGILLTDTAGGGGTMQVADLSGTTAASLKLAGSAIGGKIDGAFRYQVTVGPTDTLSQLQQDFLTADAPVTLNIVNDGGSSQPYRLMVGSTQSGAAGRLLIDPGATGISFSTLTPAADAVLQVGSAGAGNLLFTSSTNTFNNILPGLTVNVNGVSSTPATITVGQNSQALVAAIHSFVDDFNAVSSTISQVDSYDPTTQKGGVLQSDFTVQQIHETLFDLITGQSGNSTDQTRSLMQMGITLTNGQLSVNDDVLQAAMAQDPSGVQDFVGNSTNGLAKKLGDALQNITNPFDGSLQQRVNNLSQAVTDQQDRIDFLNAQIDAKKQLMLAQFSNMESVLATLQAQQSQVANLANLAVQFSGGSSSSSSSSSKSN
jgi:flagellar hook-associated protein 2